MSVDEAYSWVEYIRKRGTINVSRKLEWGFALIAMQINRALGGTNEMSDYMPHYEEEEITLEKAMETWA